MKSPPKLTLTRGTNPAREDPSRSKAKEGIFEELDAAEGQFELKVRDPYGDRVALLQFRTGAADDQLLIALEQWYDRRYVLSRRSPLQVVRSDVGGIRGGNGGEGGSNKRR